MLKQRTRFYLGQTHDALIPLSIDANVQSKHIVEAHRCYKALVDNFWHPNYTNPNQEAYVACLRLLKLSTMDSKKVGDDNEWLQLAVDSIVYDPRRYEVLTDVLDGVLVSDLFEGPGHPWTVGRLKLRAHILVLALGALVLVDKSDPAKIHFEYAHGREPRPIADTLFPKRDVNLFEFLWNISRLSEDPLTKYAIGNTLLKKALADTKWSKNTRDLKVFAQVCKSNLTRAFPSQTILPLHVSLHSTNA